MSRPFTLEYTAANGERVKEKPRLMVSVDGKEKSLVVGDNIAIVSVSFETPAQAMWEAARLKVGH